MASESAKLVDFIRSAKSRNVADEFIASMLRQNGWSDRRIYHAFSTYYESELGAPVPSRGGRLENARDAFVYLLTFISLGFWTVALVMFAYAYIDYAIPSALDYNHAASGAFLRTQVAGQLATLIIAFPLFLYLSWVLAREVGRRPEAVESGVRRWLTYIALVITAVTLLGDGVWFLSSYLSGDLSARFAWQALTLFVIAGGVFSYYLGTVRAEAVSARRDWSFAAAAIVVVAAAVLLGFTALGSPAHQRTISLDQQRLTRIAGVADVIHSQWISSYSPHYEKLPASLLEIASAGGEDLYDPVTHGRFEYHPSASATYQLCAFFDGQSPQTTYIDFWRHPAGRACFTFDARTAAPSAYGSE